MAKFTTLPIEILKQIWTLVGFRDIESFSLTCRIAHNAGAERIAEHLARKKRYSVLHIPIRSERNQQGHHGISRRNSDDFLVSVLCQIYQEPVLAEYVEHLVVDNLRHSFSDGRLAEARYELTKNKLSVLAAIIDNLPYSVDDEWIQSIETGGEAALLGLLLYLLCDVQTLRFEFASPHDRKSAFRMIYRIARDVEASALCKLHRLQIFQLGNRNLEHLAKALVLPSLESIMLEGLIESDLVPKTFKPKSSNVKELILENCKEISGSSRGFFCIFHGLETFTLVPSNEPGDLDVRRIVAGLLHHSQHSLKHLNLHARCRKRTWMGPLSSFKTLLSIHTDWRLLINESDPSSKGQLAKSLPSSIQSVHLKVDSTFDTNRSNLDMISQLVDVRKEKFEALADFKLVHIEAEAASTVLQQPFVKEAEDQGLMITCDTSIDPDGARRAEHAVRERYERLSLSGRLAALHHSE
ncbi:hypothetical protein G7Y79_00001g000490 [Physcia stellaris]|nr:hypothetical protein G7Y79_00001g000490 [Physcia stellaris]